MVIVGKEAEICLYQASKYLIFELHSGESCKL